MKELNPAERKKIAKEAISDHFPSSGELVTINEGSYCSVYCHKGSGKVLKVAAKHRLDLESFFYRTLQKHNVPSIASQRLNDFTLLLEDLHVSDRWRLATKEDVHTREIGEACANWYKAFHIAGRKELANNPAAKNKLSWEYDSINQESLHYTAEYFSLTSTQGWLKACEIAFPMIEFLAPKADTLTYDDFYYGNMAVSARGEPQITMIDFDHSGRGFAESDYRNVSSGLQGEALESFQMNFPIDADLLAFDNILSNLYSLIFAAEKKREAPWVQEVVEAVKGTDFLDSIEKAQKLLRT